MPLTLEQYVERLDARTDLPWPAAPKVLPPKAKPSIHKLPVKCVFWTVYGTLVAIPQGELQFEHPTDFVTDAALDKVIKEFKMWNSMSRKPGAPAAYLKEIFRKALTVLKMAGSGGEKYPEIQIERVWDDIVRKLQQKDYTYDAAIYGATDEFVKKLAYFYQASIQGAGAYPGAADALRLTAERGVVQGLLGDGQSFTPAQLQRSLRQQDPGFELDATIPLTMRVLSADKRARKPSETLYRAAAQLAGARGLSPSDVLHVGSNLVRDIAPAKRIGFHTALFAGDRDCVVATREELKDPATRPDVLLTELPQILEVIG
jgi:FMN phosphatase YigB (HAD superfamily)